MRIESPRRAWQRLRTRRFHRDLIVRTKHFGDVTWVNQPIWQNPLDLWTIQESISEIRPALLIEIGTYKGGSALFCAHLMDLLGTGRVITIDIAKQHDLEHPRIEFVIGSSTDDAVIEHVRAAAARAEGPVMVIIDGLHDREHVARELELYGPLVSPGSLLLSQDGVIDELGIFSDSRPGPLGANRDFLERHPEFQHDRERNERLLISDHPLGWMRRR